MSFSNPKFIGGVLLVTGTTVGAGMLALPVIASFGGFFPSILIFGICWLVMLASSFFLLDVNLSIRGEPNFISMTERTLGLTGKVLSWCFYLLLLYALIAAYIAASAPLFENAIETLFQTNIPKRLSFFCLPVAFGSFVYLGTKGVDQLNRILMIGLVISYVLLIGLVPTHMNASLLSHFDFSTSLIAIPVVMTSFGYHIIIPTLTTYLGHDKKMLRKTLIWGSVVPLIIYVIWQLLVIGTVPQGYLNEAWTKGLPATEPLSYFLKSPWIADAARYFSFFAIATSFMGVSLSLSDFLSDGLKLKKDVRGKLLAYGLTFLPPLIFLFTYSRGFYLALEYAGVFVAILLGILPSAMAWTLKDHPFYKTRKAKAMLGTVIILCLGVVLLNILEKNGAFHQLLEAYHHVGS